MTLNSLWENSWTFQMLKFLTLIWSYRLFGGNLTRITLTALGSLFANRERNRELFLHFRKSKASWIIIWETLLSPHTAVACRSHPEITPLNMMQILMTLITWVRIRHRPQPKHSAFSTWKKWLAYIVKTWTTNLKSHLWLKSWQLSSVVRFWKTICSPSIWIQKKFTLEPHSMRAEFTEQLLTSRRGFDTPSMTYSLVWCSPVVMMPHWCLPRILEGTYSQRAAEQVYKHLKNSVRVIHTILRAQRNLLLSLLEEWIKNAETWS